MNNMDNKKLQKNMYKCTQCDYITYNRANYNKHLLTNKHKNIIDILDNKKLQNVVHEYKCKCGKKYNYMSGLCKHKKKCQYKECDKTIIINNTFTEDYKELVMKLIIDNQEIKNIMLNSNKENIELRKQLLVQQKQMNELIPQIGNNNNNTTNNVKQKFNINVFLNEKCKDAISIDQFIDTIEVSIKNLLTTRDKGLGEGLSSIIIDNMNKLSVYERPMHCTDKKRETMYIKNQEWAKDDKLEQVDKLLKRVENKQLKNIQKWTDENPNFMESEKLQEEYMLLINGCTSSIDECRGKAIKKVCDKVFIEKD